MTQRGWVTFVLVCALLGGSFYALLEPHSETVEGDFRGEAALNPYLGMARVLDAMGLQVTLKRDLDEVAALPPADVTLVMLGRRAYVSEKRTAELREWVERGGHLVVRAWPDLDEDDEVLVEDPLLDALGVYARKTESDDEDDEAGDETSQKEKDELARWSPEPGVVKRIDFHKPFVLELDEDTENEPLETWSDAAGDHGYSLALGKGHITVWSDDFFLRNYNIGRWDHAELAYRLVRMFDMSGKTWIVIRDAVRRSLLSRILEGAWSVCVGLAVWLVFYLWSIAPRFGPVQPDPPAERRELMEHVKASGRFLLRNGGFDTLVSAVRGALLRRVQQRHPQWLALDSRARVERVAEHTGIAAKEIEDALESASSTQRDTLVKRIATLEAIRKRL
jgi:hypothetical protein